MGKIDLQNQLHTALEADTGRNDKKRKDAIEDVKRSTEGKLDAIKTTVEETLGQRIKTLEEKVRPLESGVSVGQKASTAVTLMKMEVEEGMNDLKSKVLQMEEETEEFEDKVKQQISEVQIDVQLLQAMQQSV